MSCGGVGSFEFGFCGFGDEDDVVQRKRGREILTSGVGVSVKGGDDADDGAFSVGPHDDIAGMGLC